MSRDALTLWKFLQGLEVGTTDGDTPSLTTGSADPEGAQTAPPGSVYLRENGSVYKKSSGTGNTGWEALAAGGFSLTNADGDITGAVDIGDSAAHGSGGEAARNDHQHAFPAPGAGYPLDVDTSAESDGTATTPARSDHKHAFGAQTNANGDITGSVDIGDTAAHGSSAEVARADHIHPYPAPSGSYPLDVAATEADGTATTPARSDHVHGLGIGTTKGDILVRDSSGWVRLPVGSDGEFLKAASGVTEGVDWDSVPGGAALTNADGDITGDINIGDAAAHGASAEAVRADHQHAYPAPAGGYPVDVVADQSEADGAATTPARADHRHAGPATASSTPATPTTAGAAGTSGTIARGDHAHPSGIATTGLSLGAYYKSYVADGTIAQGAVCIAGQTSGRAAAASSANQAPIGVALDAVTVGQTVRVAFAGVAQVLVDTANSTDEGLALFLTGTNARTTTNGGWGIGINFSMVGVALETSASGSNRLVWAAIMPMFLPLPTASATPENVGLASATGDNAEAARDDHVHGFALFTNADGDITGTVDIGDSAAHGASTEVARADHIHGFPAPGAGYPLDVDTTAEADGSATTPARSDHRHAFGAHSTANGDITGNIDIGDSAAHGSGSKVARVDHAHAFPAPSGGYPVDIDGGAEADGSATTPARSDHKHAFTAMSLTNANGDITGDIQMGDTASHGSSTEVARADHQHAFPAIIEARGATVLNPTGAITVICWRAPYACTVTAIKGYRVGGSGATINAVRRTTAPVESDLRSADLSLTSADTWMDGGAVQNTAFAAGDALLISVRSVAGSPTQVAVQVDYTRP